MNEFTGRRFRQKKEDAGNRVFFQPKLSISQPDDEYEKQADAVADNITETHEKPAAFFTPKQITAVQKKVYGTDYETSSDTEQYIGSLDGGKKLSREERHFFEPRLGHDLSNVQLHTDGEANQSASHINARAYTHGNHIVFNKNEYQPNTTEGKRLMAHELTHVVQQKAASGVVQREEKKSPPPDRYEELKDSKKAKEVFEKLNPGVLGRYCTQNCPAVAEALEEYLKTGVFPETHCDPLGEGSYGYDVGDTEFSDGVAGWEKFWQKASSNLKKHGDFLVIEAERTEKQAKDNNLTQWHYFLVLNIKGTNFIVDAYTKEVTADLSGYTTRLIANSYRYVKGDFKIKKVRVK